MSSPSPAPSPSSSSISNDERNNSGASSNLYLVTFLATLFLLLFVSCAIVLRSYILRRRYQRRLDEAMAAGMLLAPRTQGSKRKRLGAKPALFDTSLAEGGVTWEHIKPLSAQPIFVKRKYKDGRVPKDGVIISGPLPLDAHDPTNPDPSSSSSSPPNNSSTSPSPTSRSRPRLLNLPWTWWNTPRSENRTPNEPDLHDDMEVALIEQEGPALPPSPGGLAAYPDALATTPTTPTPAPVMYKVRVEMLQVSVLIAMPSPNKTIRNHKNLYHSHPLEDDDDDDEDDEDEETLLPELVFGVTRVNYKQHKAASNPTQPAFREKRDFIPPHTLEMAPETL